MNANELIYVVDDNPFNLLMISERLKRTTNAEVRSFKTATDCLTAVNKKVPDIIVSDYHLKQNNRDIDGDKLLEQVRKKYEYLPVIIYSRKEDKNLATELARKGVTDLVLGSDHLLGRIVQKVNSIYEIRREKQGELFWKLIIVVFLAFMTGIFFTVYDLNRETQKYFSLAYIFVLAAIIFSSDRTFSGNIEYENNEK